MSCASKVTTDAFPLSWNTISEPAQSTVDPSEEEYISQEIGEKLEILRRDVCVEKFLGYYEIPLPSMHADPGESLVQKMSAWVVSLTFPMGQYRTQQLAKSLGITEHKLFSLLDGNEEIPEFVDHSAIQEAENAWFSLNVFKEEMERIGRRGSCTLQADQLAEKISRISISSLSEETPCEPFAKRRRKEGSHEAIRRPLLISSQAPEFRERRDAFFPSQPLNDVAPSPKRRRIKQENAGYSMHQHQRVHTAIFRKNERGQSQLISTSLPIKRVLSHEEFCFFIGTDLKEKPWKKIKVE